MVSLELPAELKHIYSQPGTLSGPVAQRAKALYSETSLQFHLNMLSEFGLAVLTGSLGYVKEIYDRDHPSLRNTETGFEWGYVSLAVFGSQRITEDSAGGTIEHANVIRFLFENGAPVDVPDVSGRTALHHVAINNFAADVLTAVFTGRPDPNARDRYGSTPLQYAVMQGQTEVVELCLAHGGDMGIVDGDGVTPISLLPTAKPAVVAVVSRYIKRMAGIREPVEDKEQCVVCGKKGRVMRCTRCRSTTYCGTECQRVDWKNGHKTACVPFEDKEATITLKASPTPFSTMPHFTMIPMHQLRTADGIPDGEEMRREAASASKKGKSKKGKKTTGLYPDNMIGKTTIIKVQLPVGGAGPMMVYNKTRELLCSLLPDGQQREYATLQKEIEQSGWMGLKGYFMAEVGVDTLKIKVKEILATQPW